MTRKDKSNMFFLDGKTENPSLEEFEVKKSGQGEAKEAARTVDTWEIIGNSTHELLVESTINFPAEFPAIELVAEHSTIKDLTCDICKDKVIIHGAVDKSISYKSLEGSYKFKYLKAQLSAAFGSIKNISIALPFSCFVEIAGAIPGDKVEVEFAGIDEDGGSGMLDKECFMKQKNITVYKSLVEKDVVKIKLKVLRRLQAWLEE